MLVDTFLYAGEDQLLRIRLEELAGVVDRHVAIMGTHTLRGEPVRPPDFEWRDGNLSFVTVPNAAGVPFEREAAQRAFVDHLARTGADATYIHGDVDEIPRRTDLVDVAADLDERMRKGRAGAWRMRGELHQLRLDWFLPDHRDRGTHPYAGPVVAPATVYARIGALGLRTDLSVPERPLSGWHLQWVMSPADCVRKVRTFAHDEYDREPYTTEEFWRLKMREGQDPFGRWLLEPRVVDASFPRAVFEDQARWAHLLKGEVASR